MTRWSGSSFVKVMNRFKFTIDWMFMAKEYISTPVFSI